MYFFFFCFFVRSFVRSRDTSLQRLPSYTIDCSSFFAVAFNSASPYTHRYICGCSFPVSRRAFFFFLFSSVGKCEHTPMTRVHSLPCTFSLVLANLKLIASRLNACVGDPEGDRLHLLQYLFFLFLFCFTFLFNYVLDVSFIMICVLVAYGMQFLFCFFPELVNMLKKEEKRVKDRSDGCFSLFTCV